MVLIVVTHIEGEQIERAVIRVGLVTLQEHVVLSYEVARNWMQAHSQHGASQHVDHRLSPPQPVEQNIEGDLESHIGHLKLSDGFRVNAKGPYSIEKWLQNNPDKLAKASAEKPAFKISGDIYINPISTQVAMMIQVIAFERHRVGQADRQVGKDGKVAVPHGFVISKCCIVGDLVNSKGH